MNYVFNPPANWAPKMMPAMNFQIPNIGLNPNPMNVNMNMNMGMANNPMNVSSDPMNGPPPTVVGMNVQMNVNMQPL